MEMTEGRQLPAVSAQFSAQFSLGVPQKIGNVPG
jgi:hypothetical protein